MTVNAASFERNEKPVEISLDFTQDAQHTGTDRYHLMRTRYVLLRQIVIGAILNDEVQFQFDKDTGFNAATKASGTIVFIMNGTTQATGNRYYQVYFGLTGGSYSPLTVTPQVTLTDNVMDEGQTSYQIEAAGSTYYFQKQAGGFSSLVDASGNDWINFHPTAGSERRRRYIAAFPMFMREEFSIPDIRMQQAVLSPGTPKDQGKGCFHKWKMGKLLGLLSRICHNDHDQSRR